MEIFDFRLGESRLVRVLRKNRFKIKESEKRKIGNRVIGFVSILELIYDFFYESGEFVREI